MGIFDPSSLVLNLLPCGIVYGMFPFATKLLAQNEAYDPNLAQVFPKKFACGKLVGHFPFTDTNCAMAKTIRPAILVASEVQFLFIYKPFIFLAISCLFQRCGHRKRCFKITSKFDLNCVCFDQLKQRERLCVLFCFPSFVMKTGRKECENS